MKPLFSIVMFLASVISAFAQTKELWTGDMTGWSLLPHQTGHEDRPHAVNLRSDNAFKRTGNGSLAFDIARSDWKGFRYTELRLSFPKPLDARSFDQLRFSYHAPAGLKPTRLYASFIAPDWQNTVELPEAIKPVAGAWQDVAIPLTAFAKQKSGWDWSNIGHMLILFFWDEEPPPMGTVHLDAIRLERAGQGIGNRKAPPAILFLDYDPNAKEDVDATHRRNVETKGFTVVWNLLQKQTWETLSKFNAVVLGFHPESDINKPGEWAGEMAGKRQLLERYVAEGGGLLVTSTPYSKNAGAGINLLLEPMGLTLVNEQVTDPKGIVTAQERFPNMEFAYTDAVFKGALTEGVTGVWYCTSVQFTGGGGGSFTAALKPGPDWNVLIKGSRTAGSHRFQGAFGIEEAAASFDAVPPLCAARSLGKGRVAVLPMNMTHTWLSGYHPWWQGLVMNKGAEGKPSGMERLLLNLYAWLAEPSIASGSVGGYQDKALEPIKGAKFVSASDEGGIIDWKNLKPPTPSDHQHVGLIGAHSAFSDGQGTVAEWVAAAKAAGYDWVAFTEFHPKMTAEKWEQLKAECKKVSDDKFCALPGLEFVDQAGDHSLVLAPIPWPDPKLENDRMDLPHAVGYAYNFPAQVQFRFGEGLAPWYRNMFRFAGMFTYREGKLVDDAEEKFHELSARTFNIWPVAVHETFKPQDVARERATGYQTWYTFGAIDQMREQFCFPGYNQFFHRDFVYVSSGPRIGRFAAQNNGTAYFDIPPESPDAFRSTESGDRWRVVIHAAADAGLSRVRLLDSGKPLRSFRAAESKFSQTIEGHHDRQYCLGLEVVDKKGGRALAAAASSSAGRHWFGNCTDNVNIMEGGTYGTTDRRPLGYECYFPRWGYWLWPDLAVKDRPPLQLPHDERLQFASADCTIVDHLFTMTHDPKVLPVGGGRMLRPLAPIRDFEARVRAIRFTAGVDTPEFVILEPWVKLKREVTVMAGAFPNLRLLYILHSKPMAKGDFAFATVTAEDGRTLAEATPASDVWPRVSHQGTLPVGGYAGAFPNYTGAGAVFALEPGIQFAIEGNAEGRRIQIGKDLAPGTVLKSGTILSTRVLYMEGKWRQPAGNTEIETARQLLGLNGRAGYIAVPSIGAVADTRFTCTLKTEKGAFRSRFSRAPLPVDLPILVPGLQPGWDAVVWVIGAERARHFGIFEGTGHTTLRLDKKPLEAFIGHPLTCDSPRLNVSLVEADKNHLLIVLHNPTEKPIQTRLRKSAGFDLGPPLDKKVVVPMGESVRIEVAR
ncbi:MAG: hypothetical protein HY360_23420 [Verrucomicrobia bacterium]|nr:hypothetical protein [Verrucomicrobiota bacterium]